jgi:hypothetical protein
VRFGLFAACAHLQGCDFPNDWGFGGPQYVPPARAAVAVAPLADTDICSIPNFSIPTDPIGMDGVVHGALSCDLNSPACKPDEYTVAQGDPGVTVACRISPSGGSFNVEVDVRNGALHFQAAGALASSGGMLDVSREGGGPSFRDRACKISIPPDGGAVKKGAIWAQFECALLALPDASRDATCTESGAFIFENCGN